jgi:hypothetical protein
LKPDDVRAILMKTARDLGAPGRDDLFGAGEADAFAAVSAAGAAGTAPAGPGTAPAGPVARVSAPPAADKVSDRQDTPATRALNEPPAAMAAEKPATSNANRPAVQ